MRALAPNVAARTCIRPVVKPGLLAQVGSKYILILCFPKGPRGSIAMSKSDDPRVLIVAVRQDESIQGDEQQGQPSTSGRSATSFTLPDPRTGRSSAYLLVDGCLQEVSRFKQMYSSWLLDDQLVADGSIFLGTPVDPLFILLPLLEAARGKDGGVFKPLEELLPITEWPALAQVAHGAEASGALRCICDVRCVDVDSYYRLSDERALAWLSIKQRCAQEALKPQLAGMDASAASAYVHGWLSEWMSPTWSRRLATHLGIETDEGQVLRPSLAANTPGSAAGCEPGSNTPLSGTRVGDPHAWGAERSGNGQPSEKRPRLDPKAAALAKAAEARATKAAEVRAKQAEGTKKISAFFGKR